MKEAVLIGGSHGIGMAIADNLINKKEYFVHLFGISEPDKTIYTDSSRYKYHFCDLNSPDFSELINLSESDDIDLLFITAGIGKFCLFEEISIDEITVLLSINTISTIKILRLFYNKIKSKKDFYTGIMGSMSGLVSSPLYSVYSASKAAICRFTESVNIELEVSGTTNRILNVSPGAYKGTRFNDSGDNISLLRDFAEEILLHTFNKDTIFIPNYDEIYKNVIDRYHSDPHKFGLDSYNYKINKKK